MNAQQNKGQEPKLIIFDCDGTIIDSQDIIIQAMSMAFTNANYSAPTRENVRAIIGLSLDEAVVSVAQSTIVDASEAHIDQLSPILVDGYKQAFVALREQAEHKEPMFDGARAVIENLAARDDVLLGIATGKSRRGLDVVLERENLTDHFHNLKNSR